MIAPHVSQLWCAQRALVIYGARNMMKDGELKPCSYCSSTIRSAGFWHHGGVPEGAVPSDDGGGGSHPVCDRGCRGRGESGSRSRSHSRSRPRPWGGQPRRVQNQRGQSTPQLNDCDVDCCLCTSILVHEHLESNWIVVISTSVLTVLRTEERCEPPSETEVFEKKQCIFTISSCVRLLMGLHGLILFLRGVVQFNSRAKASGLNMGYFTKNKIN